MGNAGAGRPKFKKPTLESYCAEINREHAMPMLRELDQAFEAVIREKGRRSAQFVLDAFNVERITDLPSKFYLSFLSLCKDQLKD